MRINDLELSDRDKLLRRITATVIDACNVDGIFNNCLNCGNFDEEFETCALCCQRPPARVVVSGCERHTNELPF